MDRRCSRKFSQDCFEVSKFMTRFWRHNSSRRWWSCKICQESYPSFNWSSQSTIKLCLALFCQVVQRRRTEETVSVLLWTQMFRISVQSKDIQEVLSLILHCRGNVLLPDDFADYIYHIGIAHDMHSIIQADWFQEEKVSKRHRQPVFFHSREHRCTPIKIWKKFNTIWTNSELRCTKILESSPKIENTGAIWSSLKERIAVISNPIARNRSFQHTTCDLYWENGLHEDWSGFIL